MKMTFVIIEYHSLRLGNKSDNPSSDNFSDYTKPDYDSDNNFNNCIILYNNFNNNDINLQF